VLCGDSTKIEDVERLMDGKKADMVFTDPPYGVSYAGGLQFKNNGNVVKDNQEMIKNDETDDIYSDVIPIISMICNGACYVWFAGTKALKLYSAVESVGDIHSLIIWVKNGGYGALNANYKQKHEPCLYWKPKGKTLNFTGGTTETTVWNIDKDGKNKMHPTQKPVELAHKAIMNHSAGLITDLFLGSGSTIIACEKTNRICYGMELDEHYCDVIRDRYIKWCIDNNKPYTVKLNGQNYKFE
jgi:DNA modification methylase